MPLNLRERINSRISLLCSVIVLVLLVLVMHQMDYTLIRKPQKEAAEAAALKEQQDKIKAETPVISTASVIAVGDNLYHSMLYQSGETDSGAWNYDQIYASCMNPAKMTPAYGIMTISTLMFWTRSRLQT